MKRTPVSTEAITLRRYNFSDSSQVVHLLTRSAGRISALAKGIKRSKLVTVFDLFSYGYLAFLPKPEGALQLVTEFAAVDTFPGIRASLDRFHAALYVLEIVPELVPEHEPAPEVFQLLLNTLRTLERVEPAATATVLISAELRLLKLTGFAPRTGSCLGCGQSLLGGGEGGSAAAPRFLPGRGGCVCTTCFARRVPPPPLAVPVSRGTLRILANLAQTTLLDLLPGADVPRPPALPPPAIRELRALLDAHIRAIIEKDLKSVRFLALPARGSRLYSSPP